MGLAVKYCTRVAKEMKKKKEEQKKKRMSPGGMKYGTTERGWFDKYK